MVLQRKCSQGRTGHMIIRCITQPFAEYYLFDAWLQEMSTHYRRGTCNYKFCVFFLCINFVVSSLFQRRVQFSVNLDVTSYKNGVRETHNPKGRALAPVVWDFYDVRKMSIIIIMIIVF